MASSVSSDNNNERCVVVDVSFGENSMWEIQMMSDVSFCDKYFGHIGGVYHF